jgi:hypothetical protein
MGNLNSNGISLFFGGGEIARLNQEVRTLRSKENKTPSNLKLEAQKIKEFGGDSDDWNKWKSRTECALSGSGYEQVLEDEDFARENPDLNKVVYSQLLAATVDGTAYHLVQAAERNKDGHQAWINLCEWYDGEDVHDETAENLRTKLDNLRLHTGIKGADYVNKFLAWYRDLEKIPGEAWSKSHAKQQFLKHITDPEYDASVQHCMHNNADLEECVTVIRKHERYINQKKLDVRRAKTTLRRMHNVESDDDDETLEPPTKKQKTSRRRRVFESKDTDNKKFEGELTTCSEGLLRFIHPTWKSMTPDEHKFVRDYNSKIKHKESPSKLVMPKGISIKVRRNNVETTTSTYSNFKTKTQGQGKKKISFGLGEAYGEDMDEDTGLHEE